MEVRVWVVSFGVRLESLPQPLRGLETGRLSLDPSIYGGKYIECFDDVFVMVLKTLGLSDRAQVDVLRPSDFRRLRINGGTVLLE